MKLIKEGFCWPAFFLSFLWALWHRLWLAAAAFLALDVGVSWLIADLGIVSQLAVSIGLAVVFGYLGNDLRRWKLDRGGYTLSAVVAGRDRDGAEQRYLDSEPLLAAELSP